LSVAHGKVTISDSVASFHRRAVEWTLFLSWQ
jgi:hypothetical protein